MIKKILLLMKVILSVCLCFCTFLSWGQNKQICITVDDLPTVTYGSKDPQLDIEITNKLNHTFKRFQIPAIGYVVENQLYSGGTINPAKIDLLRTWLKNGNDLGNHTYSHHDYNSTVDSVYFNDIIKGETITRSLLEEYGKTLRYFRHPYLRAGINQSRSDSLNKFLAKHRYTVAPVTIDNDDYLFARFYHNAYIQRNDSLMDRIGKSYVDYMQKKLLFFEQKSEEVFNEKITQTLLIHASLINADYLDELAAMYLKHGYKFVSQEKALEDKAYLTPVTYYTPRGVSWIYRWGISNGMTEQLMEGDIETPAYIVEMNDKF